MLIVISLQVFGWNAPRTPGFSIGLGRGLAGVRTQGNETRDCPLSSLELCCRTAIVTYQIAGSEASKPDIGLKFSGDEGRSSSPSDKTIQNHTKAESVSSVRFGVISWIFFEDRKNRKPNQATTLHSIGSVRRRVAADSLRYQKFALWFGLLQFLYSRQEALVTDLRSHGGKGLRRPLPAQLINILEERGIDSQRC